MHRAFTFRLDPTVKQSRALEQCMALQCELYNAALEERRMSYEWRKRQLSSARVPDKLDQFRTLTGLADLRPELKPFGVTLCRGTLTRLDEAFAGFFRRVKEGEAPGYPRFKSRARFDSLSWCDISGWKLDETSRRLYIQGVGHVKINLHRSVHADVNAARNILRAGLAQGGNGARAANAEPVNR
ncbi:MAG: helix-turn-helix domain-containing protein [Acidimicrobiales bacterium]